MRRCSWSLLAAVAILGGLCSGAWAAGTTINDSNKPTTWGTAGSPYTVTGSVTIADRITVSGSVTLILGDGCALTANKGISVNEGNSLTIEGGTGSNAGRLTATSVRYYAAIGGDDKSSAGTITITGGTVTASAAAGYGAGIGGGRNGSGGNIKITGGTVTASSTANAAGIGGGRDGSGGVIMILGGTVTATGGDNAAGIGGGYRGSSGIITIDDGTVTASSPTFGAGIGGGSYGSGDRITINGGTVIAQAGSMNTTSGGAGIGGGYQGSSGKITITGGNVSATAWDYHSTDKTYAAAIGGGGDGWGKTNSTRCDITITGGTVNAVSYSGSAIGGGCGSGGTIKISGGKVTALSQYYGTGAGIGGGPYGSGITITILGGDMRVSGYFGASIGSGMYGSNAAINISGGKVFTTSSLGEAGIGDGRDAPTQSTTALSSDPNGSAWIYARLDSTIVHDFNGTIFDGAAIGNGKVYGSAAIIGDVEIPIGMTLEIPAGAKLTVRDGSALSLANGAKLAIDTNGTLENSGDIDSRNGSFENNGGDIANDGFIYLSDSTTVPDIKALGIPRTELGRILVGSKKYFNDDTEDVSPNPTSTPTPTPAPSYTPGKYTGAIDRYRSDELWNALTGGSVTIYIGVSFDQFAEAVSLDGVPLTQDTASVSHDFGAREGSTIITIWEKTLKDHITTDGEHRAEVGFNDGTAIHTFTVRGTGETGETDRSSGGGCAAGAAALVALAALALRRRNRSFQFYFKYAIRQR